MIFDHSLVFSDDQDLAVEAGNHLSTNTLPVGQSDDHPAGAVPTRDLGRGGGMDLVIQVTESFEGGTSVQAQVVMADNSEMNQNLVVVAQTGAIPTAQLVQGYKFSIPEVPAGLTKPYMAIRYVTEGEFTAGKVQAGMVLNRTDAPPFN